MSDAKTAGSKATWALLAEGVASARLEAHRLHHLMTRAMKIVEKSPERDHIYQMAGDILLSAPRRMEALERHLDRLSYTLSVIGTDHLRDLLPMDDRAVVDSATAVAGVLAPQFKKSSQRVADQWLARQVARRHLADLNPSLGLPREAGPCYVAQRIYEEVRDPKLRDELIEDVERGLKLTNQQASQVYDLERERGDGVFTKLEIVPHAQYRMDQRGVPVTEVRLALRSFSEAWQRGRSLLNQNVKKPALVKLQNDARQWERDIARREPVRWKDPPSGVVIVFVVQGTTARLITTYQEGVPDPKSPGVCPVHA